LTVPPFGHEFVRNILANIGCNPFYYYIMVLNWHCIDTIENLKKKTCINFIPCCAYVALTNDMLKAYKVAQV
jgi:hypothetical protein